MFTEKHFPDSISGPELDEYLHRGWYRMGQSIFTCHFIFFEENIYSPVWIRLPLKGYTFHKSLRKIILKNQRLFRVVIRPGIIDDEKETLFQIYRAKFKGILAPTVKNSLQDDSDQNIFNSLEVTVYDDDQLVAFSFFDIGADSIASIKGVYDPAYSQYSLGLYTMLAEIQYGLDHGYQYYYPGYVVPGYPRFDYKLRIGRAEEMEFYDVKSRSWLPYSQFAPQRAPVNFLVEKLRTASQSLTAVDIASQMLYYPAYDAHLMTFDEKTYLESPLFLTLFSNVFPRPRFLVYYDVWQEKYIFTHCMPAEDLDFYFSYSMQYDQPEARHFLDFMLTKNRILETENLQDIVKMAVRLSYLVKPPEVVRFVK